LNLYIIEEEVDCERDCT